VLAVKNCNWPPAEANPIRYRRDISDQEFDLNFSLNFDDLYINYILQYTEPNLKVTNPEGSGSDSGSETGSESEEDRWLARLNERQNKKVQAQLAKAEKMCRSKMNR